MLTYSRWAPTETVASTIEHIRAHLSAIASPDDDPEVYADEVQISREDERGGLLLTGSLDREPHADYLAEGYDPYAGVPEDLRGEVE